MPAFVDAAAITVVKDGGFFGHPQSDMENVGLMVAEKRFRRLQAPELMAGVYLGAQCVDGMAVEATAEKAAA